MIGLAKKDALIGGALEGKAGADKNPVEMEMIVFICL
jgi:hypothetical protein